MRTSNRIRLAVALSLLAAAFASAQVLFPASIVAKIPFAFNVSGKVLPAGEYNFSANDENSAIVVRSADRKTEAIDSVLTRLAGAIHTTANDAHVVFDKVGNDYTLSEMWVPGVDGFVLSETKGAHQHSVIDVPVARR